MTAMVQEFQYGEHYVVLETGIVARQATAAVMASMGDTTVLATVVGVPQVQVEKNFLPLTVHYQERTYAAGRIPGGFFRREGRPGESEVLTARLIDRPLRPLFPTGFYHEVQIVVTVLSVDPQINPDIVAMIATSAALTLSGIPFSGPIGAARVGFIDGQYLLNPSCDRLKESHLDLVVAGTQHAVIMVESEADQLTEAQMLGAMLFGHQQQQVVIENIKQFALAAGKPRWDWQAPNVDTNLHQQVAALATQPIIDAYSLSEKSVRQQKLMEVKQQVVKTIQSDDLGFSEPPQGSVILSLLHQLEKQMIRRRLLAGEARIDQRDPLTVRALAMSVGVLPRTHGSALFTRGETQALVTVTLGTERDAQTVDELLGERTDSLLLHYNFPPYAVGETGMLGSPKRREIGHGRLAKRGLAAVMPTSSEFPYTIRVVSEITESNGSSSMATVCGASLALMDAGVPLKAPVAGVAMGLIKGSDQSIILTDISGDEDHLGDMDFKVAGTKLGITALQMDMKVDDIDQVILQTALQQAKGARLHILQIMKQAIDQPRDDVSDWAPRIHTFKIDPLKTGEVIGKGGAVIRALSEETGSIIDVNKKDGTITVSANNCHSIQNAINRITELTAEVKKGEIYTGKVSRLADYGAFVALNNGKEGLVHISQLSQQRVDKVNDCVTIGQQVQVKLLEIERQGRLRLSIKEAQMEALTTTTSLTHTAMSDSSYISEEESGGNESDSGYLSEEESEGNASDLSYLSEEESERNESDLGYVSEEESEGKEGDSGYVTNSRVRDQNRITELTAEVKKGEIYTGKVFRLADYGAFVALNNGQEGLVHISQLSQQRVDKVSDCVTIGQQVQVKLLGINHQGQLRLSIKEAQMEALATTTSSTRTAMSDSSYVSEEESEGKENNSGHVANSRVRYRG